MNQTHLKSLANFPENEKLVRLELAENQLPGAELQHLQKYASSLQTLKLASNKIANISDLSSLKEMKCLKNLDLENNSVQSSAGYRDHVFKLIPSLEVLDNVDKDGNEVISEGDDDDYGAYGEEGEDEMHPTLTEEQRAELERKGISVEDFLNGNVDFDSEEGEEDFEDFEDGEDDFAEDDSEEPAQACQQANKRSKH